ncbi:MAG: Xaa-Pro dipeptidase, partial [Pseudomonadota bacterium]
MRTMGFLVIFFLSLSGFADAQKKALVGGTLLDGLGGPPIYDSVILVDGDRIEEVGNQDSLQIPDGYEVIS